MASGSRPPASAQHARGDRLGSCDDFHARRAVFIDRDGVINRAIVRDGRPYAPASLDQFDILPRAREAVDRLHRGGFLVIVVTNQPDVGHGRHRREEVEAMHAQIRDRLAVDDIKVCYHREEDECGCRKPKPGMLLEAAAEWSIALGRSFMVGDRWRDIEAGKAAGCRTVLIRSLYRETPAEGFDAAADSLLEASDLIVTT